MFTFLTGSHCKFRPNSEGYDDGDLLGGDNPNGEEGYDDDEDMYMRSDDEQELRQRQTDKRCMAEPRVGDRIQDTESTAPLRQRQDEDERKAENKRRRTADSTDSRTCAPMRGNREGGPFLPDSDYAPSDPASDVRCSRF